MAGGRGVRRRLAATIAACAWALVFAGAAPVTAQPAQEPAATDTLRDDRPAAVLLDGREIFSITAGTGPYSTAFRAQRISERLTNVLRDRTLHDLTVNIVDTGGTSELHVGPHLVMAVTSRDAADIGVSRQALAEQYARVVEAAIRSERQLYAPAALVRAGVYAALATALFAAFVWIVIRATRTARRLTARWGGLRSETLRVMQDEWASSARAVRGAAFALRAAFILVGFDYCITYVLGLFPWTRAVSTRVLDYVFSPLRAVVWAMVGYLPQLLFLIVIALAVSIVIRIVNVFFRHIRNGRLIFANFPPEWADPTNKIARVLLIAFGVVVAFPYLPAAHSPAFAGVSVFMGVLVSLASSSALSNMIAGIVLTYTGAFRLGDRVKIGDTFGDIIETSLLATRVRTIKNEDVTIPNGIALGTAVTNYTREAGTRGLILHTSVTIGYNTPWRQVHDLLTAAALATADILDEPRPFVWQTALSDFFVTYEINAYTRTPARMIDIYAELHSRIQDSFYAAGVEIMSPHYTALRDGNTVAIPEAFRPPDYQAQPFRVEAPSQAPAHTALSAVPPSGPAGLPRKPAS
jgi:small-conductance mechanosensitive channel